MDSTGSSVGGGEKKRKIKMEQESRTRNALVFLAIMTLFFVAALVKLRHNHDVPKSQDGIRLRKNRLPEKFVDEPKPSYGDQSAFIPPNSLYKLSVPDLSGEMVSLEKFHGMVTLIVNVACM